MARHRLYGTASAPSTTASRRLIPLLAVAVACVLSLAAAAEGDPRESGPLTNEDVVRMVMSGLDEEAILQRIESSPAAFDLGGDLPGELRVAGVSGRIIEAMAARMRAAGATPGSTEDRPPAPPAARGWIEVTFDVDPTREPAVSSAVAPAVVQWQEKGKPEEELPARMAFVLLCTVPTHVPDHWESATKLGVAGRHRLLLLEDASKPIEGQPQLLYAPLPEAFRVEVEPGLHQGMVGFALRLGEQEKYLALYLEPFKDLEVAAGEVTGMKLRIRSPGARRRTRRGFLKMNPKGLTTEAGWLGDPRLQPTIKVIEITPPPSLAKPDGPATPAAEPGS